MNYTPELVSQVIEKKVAQYGNQSRVAKATGLCASTLSKWRHGQLLPSPETFFKYFPVEEPKCVERPKQIPVESIFVADHRQEMMDVL